MKAWFDIECRGIVHLDRPFSLYMELQEPKEFGADNEEVCNRIIDAYSNHVKNGAFKIDVGARSLEHAHLAPAVNIDDLCLRIKFPCFPFQPQGLRILVRALQYSRRRAGVKGPVVLASETGGGISMLSSRILRDPDSLIEPLEESPTSFDVASRWCGKDVRITLEFYDTIELSTVDILDELVSSWAVLADHGGYATKNQLEALVEYEALFESDTSVEGDGIEVLLDLPVVGDDFCEWHATQFNVDSESVTTLLNMISAVQWTYAKPSSLEIS